MIVLHIIPDTNLALHFKRLDQVDWRSITGAKECVIHIPPIYLRELEEQKVHNDKKKLRSRAATTIKWLTDLADKSDPIVLRDGVELQFIDHEPLIDFAANRLSERVSDDVLLASAISLANELGESVAIASGDGGLKMKIRTRDQLTHLALGTEYRLPSELDPVEKELRDKTAELERLKSRFPKLAVKFADQAEFHNVVLLPEPETIPKLEEVKRKYHRLPTAPSHEGQSEKGLESIFKYHANSAYNENLEAYFQAYERYERDLKTYNYFWSRSFQVGFIVENNGRAPANSVEIIFEFPDSVKISRARELPNTPRVPSPPQRNATLTSQLGHGVIPKFEPFLPHLDIDSDGKASVRDNRVTLQYSVGKLKHGFVHNLEKVYVTFVGEDGPASFSVPYYVYCDDADADEGTLNFVVE